MIQGLLQDQPKTPNKTFGMAFAPSNIALIKYWGKRDTALNLPLTSSLSISLGDKGATTRILPIDADHDEIFLNHKAVPSIEVFYTRLVRFLDLLRPDPHQHYRIETTLNLPVAAGLASSACGFAAAVLAFADLYAWEVPLPVLSVLCRLGSGSAARSLWHGFVEWHRGERADGLDSYAEPLLERLDDLAIGLHILSSAQKPLGSREAMERTRETSRLYDAWPKQVAEDLYDLKQALSTENFAHLGAIAERNALAMHATMLAATPAICYWLPETLSAMQTVWSLRADGLPVYFTEDAGPNLKLLTLKKHQAELNAHFPALEWVLPFEPRNQS